MAADPSVNTLLACALMDAHLTAQPCRSATQLLSAPQACAPSHWVYHQSAAAAVLFAQRLYPNQRTAPVTLHSMQRAESQNACVTTPQETPAMSLESTSSAQRALCLMSQRQLALASESLMTAGPHAPQDINECALTWLRLLLSIRCHLQTK